MKNQFNDYLLMFLAEGLTINIIKDILMNKSDLTVQYSTVQYRTAVRFITPYRFPVQTYIGTIWEVWNGF